MQARERRSFCTYVEKKYCDTRTKKRTLDEECEVNEKKFRTAAAFTHTTIASKIETAGRPLLRSTALLFWERCGPTMGRTQHPILGVAAASNFVYNRESKAVSTF